MVSLLDAREPAFGCILAAWPAGYGYRRRREFVRRLAAKKAVYEDLSENGLAENKGRLSSHPLIDTAEKAVPLAR